MKLGSASPRRTARNGILLFHEPKEGGTEGQKQEGGCQRPLDLLELEEPLDTYQRLGSKVSRRSWGRGGTGEIKPLKHAQGSLFNLSSSILRLDIEARTRNATHLAASHLRTEGRQRPVLLSYHAYSSA